MHPNPTSPLGQAFAAFFALLIAAIAEHAAEHPLLAPGLRAAIRRLEKLAHRLDAMIAEWEASRTQPHPKRPRHPAFRARQGIAAPDLRPPIPIRNPATIPRASRRATIPRASRRATTPRAPPLPDSRRSRQELRGQPGQSGAAPMYTPRHRRPCA